MHGMDVLTGGFLIEDVNIDQPFSIMYGMDVLTRGFLIEDVNLDQPFSIMHNNL